MSQKIIPSLGSTPRRPRTIHIPNGVETCTITKYIEGIFQESSTSYPFIE